MSTAVQGAESRKGRLMGKLFGGRERKVSNEQRDVATGGDEINAFLHGPSQASMSPTSPRSSTATRPSFDGFQVNHAAPPQLAKLDTRSISRYPNAAPMSAVSQSPVTGKYPTKPPRPAARGLHVVFANSYPEIIGEGGDESEIPTAEIGRRRREMRASPNPQAYQQQQQHTYGAPSYNLPLRSPVPPFQAQQAAQQQYHQPQQQQQQQPPAFLEKPYRTTDGTDDFVPAPIRRTQTGYTSITDNGASSVSGSVNGRSPRLPFVSQPEPRKQASPERVAPSQLAPAALLDAPVLGSDEKRRSYIEAHQAEMRKAEGLALANALRNGPVSPPSSPEIDEKRPVSPMRNSPVKMTPPPALPAPRNPHNILPQTTLPQHPPANPEVSPIIPPPSAATPDGALWGRPRQVAQAHSPPLAASPTASVHRAFNAFRQNTANNQFANRDPDSDAVSPISTTSASSIASPRAPPATGLHDVVQAAGDDALNTFINRSRHLFELFRLQSETLRPLSACNATDLARAALWWFLVGRMSLESSFRERSVQGADSPVSRANEFAMQQAYADLAKSYWLAGEIMSEKPATEETEQARSVLMYQLRKLSVSMARNNIMPPEDAFLPQTIDKTIWATYPSISSDIVSLLWGNWGSGLTSTPMSAGPPMLMADALPLGDSSDDFIFSRMKADVYLMEQGRETNHPQTQFHFPCMLSVARPHSSAMLEIVVASQNETVQLRVRGKKGAGGPTWDDVRWRSDMSSLELRLPRGFVLAIQLTKPDFGLLWSMYDFGSKIHSQLYPRRDENPVFRTTLKAFQYFETGPPTGSFPKEAVPECEVALFEKVVQENAATGRRHFHRGFRIAVVSGTRTRTLYGISQNFLPDVPLQFNFLRGEQGAPALLLRFENSRSKGNMVLSFAHSEERTRLHSLLADTVVHQNERKPADVPILSLDVRLTSRAAKDAQMQGGNGSGNAALGVFKKLALKRLMIVNLDDEPDETTAPTVLSEHLKMVYENGESTLVDRVNVAPGELKIRLDVRCNTSLTILRQGQQDLTVAVPDMQVAREMGGELAHALRVAKAAPTCRMLRFNTLADLHAVQEAITGFRVLYDGVATSLMIARRRLVVPIHKKWESGATRIQVVTHPDTKVVQLLAFFQDFHYGQCMSFVLKGTDVYEAFGRGNKAGIKFDDAKFPLPRLPEGSSDDKERSEKSGSLSPGLGSSASQLLKNFNGSNASLGSNSSATTAGDDIVSETAFVCLDMPDLPGEHDDISILFDKESERDRLATCLPAPMRGSRLAKMF